MTAILNTIVAILTLLPKIIETVQAVENAIPMSGAGKQKADMVLQAVEAAGDGATESIPMIQKLIDIVVKTMNTIGAFKK